MYFEVWFLSYLWPLGRGVHSIQTMGAIKMSMMMASLSGSSYIPHSRESFCDFCFIFSFVFILFIYLNGWVFVLGVKVAIKKGKIVIFLNVFLLKNIQHAFKNKRRNTHSILHQKYIHSWHMRVGVFVFWQVLECQHHLSFDWNNCNYHILFILDCAWRGAAQRSEFFAPVSAASCRSF